MHAGNVMAEREDIESLERFKVEATGILEDAKFPLHKRESNVEELDGGDILMQAKLWVIIGTNERTP